MLFKDKKTAFIFPGQGSQYIGMSIDYIGDDPELITVLENFKMKTGVDLYSIMKDGPEDLLKETRYTQPAILFHSIAALRAFKRRMDISPVLVAGHSLGEFTALVANEVLSFEDALYLVHKRGEFMIKANDGRPFAMYAIMGPDFSEVKSFCELASTEGIVVAANYNTPVQTVISGEKAAVEKAAEIARESGTKKIIPLVVGGAFHSPLIEKAGIWLQQEMDTVLFSNTSIPVVSNVDALPATDTTAIKEKLVAQITSSVLWVDCVNYMIKEGVELFIEFGPQKVLAGMIRKIDRNIEIFSMDKLSELDEIVEKLLQESGE